MNEIHSLHCLIGEFPADFSPGARGITFAEVVLQVAILDVKKIEIVISAGYNLEDPWMRAQVPVNSAFGANRHIIVIIVSRRYFSHFAVELVDRRKDAVRYLVLVGKLRGVNLTTI